MPRVRPGFARTRRRNKILRQARGYYGTRHAHFQIARETVIRAGVFAFRDRRARKRDMRSLWITRITAACRMRGLRYAQFIHGLKQAGILLNRKMLSQIAIDDPKTFDAIVDQAKKAVA